MKTEVERRLERRDIFLPNCPSPVALYRPAKRIGQFVYSSGQTAWVDKKMLFKGKVGSEVSIEDAQDSARYCALNCISAMREVADLDKIQILKVLGFVNAGPLFEDHPLVVNGASELLITAFGEKGIHSRSAIGVASLPSNASVEIEIMACVCE